MTDISSQIGALEISALMTEVFDAALEDASGYAMAGPTSHAPFCKMTIARSGGCLHNDGAVEAAAATAAAPSYNMGCTSTQGNMCRRIEDGTLEAAAGNVSLEPSGFNQPCPTFHSRCIDDNALEALADPQPRPMTIPFQLCRRIDDGAIEDAAGYAMAGPTIAPCTVMTCRRIDDDALEASAGNLSIEPSGFNQPCPTFHSRCIDNGAN